ncbi:MAG: ribosome maturation factor RimM [Spiroplasma sp.]|nr:ribosome maturation factor RimM [Mycoplasmatales bacterium]
MQVKIGKIVNTHGIKGELRILSNSDFKELRFAIGNDIWIATKAGEVMVTIEGHFPHKTFDIVKLKDYDNINDVLQFKNLFIYDNEIATDQMEDDNYLNKDLIGCVIINEDNIKRGTVTEVIENPAHDLLRIQGDDKKFFIPFINEFILEIDLESKTIIIDEIKGLIDED